MDLHFRTCETNASRPNFRRTYPIPYKRIVGISSANQELWTPEQDDNPRNDYSRDMTRPIDLRLPQQFGHRILQYFEEYFTAPPDYSSSTNLPPLCSTND